MATFQFIYVLGVIKPILYAIPIIIGGVVGLLVSFWMQRFQLAQLLLRKKKSV